MNYQQWRSLLVKRFNIPQEQPIRKTLRSFTTAQKAVMYTFVALFTLSSVLMVCKVGRAFLVAVPARGGTLVEGVVGNPRFINPVLAISEADKNLAALIYSGLVRLTPEGEVENDLANHVEISSNGLIYTATINPDAAFHDGTSVTADDVLFTIAKITDPLVKSPRRGDWDDVTVEKIDDKTVKFSLTKPYEPFINNLTVGILPKNIWKNVSDEEFAFSQFNTLPIGTGPYKVARVERNSGGIPDFYQLTPFTNDIARSAYIDNLTFRFYPNEDMLVEAYNKSEIESFGGISPDKTALFNNSHTEVISSPLPRIFAVFFNQNQAKVLANKEVRQALDLASPKEEIVKNVLGGYATVIDSPLPAGVFSWSGAEKSSTTSEQRLVQAQKLLADNGWKKNEKTGVLEKKSKTATMTLSFTISTGDAPELKAVATELVNSWGRLGAKVDILVHETGDLNQNVIRPRQFDALLFGEVVGRDADVYPFWHSSQRNDPGLNIASYANNRVDKLITDARSASDPEVRDKDYQEFEKEIKADMPAIFLYTPSFLYALPTKVAAVSLSSLSAPQDRFLGVRDWYIEKDKIWKIFTD